MASPVSTSSYRWTYRASIQKLKISELSTYFVENDNLRTRYMQIWNERESVLRRWSRRVRISQSQFCRQSLGLLSRLCAHISWLWLWHSRSRLGCITSAQHCWWNLPGSIWEVKYVHGPANIICVTGVSEIQRATRLGMAVSQYGYYHSG